MLKRRPLPILAAFVVGLATLALAADPKPADKADADQAVKITPAAEAVLRIATAEDLIDYGRKQKAPEALITAARILGTTPPGRSVDLKPTVTAPDKPPPPAGEKHPSLSRKPADLLEEAKRMAPDDKAVAALADQVAKIIAEKPKGPTIGAVHLTEKDVKPGAEYEYRYEFNVAELAVANVTGTGESDLQLTILDDARRPVQPADTGVNSQQQWIPLGPPPPPTQFFIIRVRNIGSETTSYDLDVS